MKTNSKLADSIAAKLKEVANNDNEPATVAGHAVKLLPRAEIYVTEQVRKTYSDSSLKELADSIGEMGKVKGDQYKGLLQAISVGARDEKGYPVTFGHRRFLAIDTFLKWDFVPAKVDETARDDLIVLGAEQMVENIQREELHPIEVALGIAQQRELGQKSGEIAKMLGKPQSYVSKHLKIASIPMDLLLDLTKVSQDVEALYAIGQLVKLDGTVAHQLVKQAVADGKLSRADVVATINRVELTARKANLPSAMKIGQAIRDYYLNDPQEHLTLSALRELLEVIEDDHELFIAVAAPILSQMDSEREDEIKKAAELAGSVGTTDANKAPESASGSTGGEGQGVGTTDANKAPENASGSTGGEGQGVGATDANKAPENASGSTGGNGQGSGTPDAANAPVNAHKLATPTIKVRWLEDGKDGASVELRGHLLLSLSEAEGIKPAEGMALVMTEAGAVVTAAMDDLMISGVVYA